VARFVLVNGPWWVIEATKRACLRLQAARAGTAAAVAEPWVYLRAVVNGRPARAQHLYLLLFLWETSLRARIDYEYSVTAGEDWFRDPDQYLSIGHAFHLYTDQAELFERDTTGKLLVGSRYRTARGFMRELYLGALHNMLLDKWDTVFKARLPHPLQGEIIASQVNSWLRDAFSARREVMHADRIELAFFQQSVAALTLLLEMLGFDVTKALAAIETRDPHAEDQNL
jgi:hypothetical protein